MAGFTLSFNNGALPFTGSRDDTIPEYLFSRAASVEEGAEIWEITSTGNERLTAVFDGKTWIPVMG